MNGSIINGFNGTGRVGRAIDTGKGKEPGAYRAINLYHNNRDRNSDIKGSSSINRDLKSRDSSNLRFSRDL